MSDTAPFKPTSSDGPLFGERGSRMESRRERRRRVARHLNSGRRWPDGFWSPPLTRLGRFPRDFMARGGE